MRAAVSVGLCAAAACGSSGVRWETGWDSEYGRFDAQLRAEYRAARDFAEAGEWESSWGLLVPLTRAHPYNLQLAVDLQEVELELLAARSPADPALAALAREPDPEEALRKAYAERAEADATVVNFVLAARLESDSIACQHLLDRALELDPGCAWAHYGQAHALLRQRGKNDRWLEAGEALARALELDPGHVGARRLEAWMRAQEGAVSVAAKFLGTWLEVTRDDPRVTTEARITAELDLALFLLLDGRPARARELLAGLEGNTVARGRRLALLAATEQALGDLFAALDAARRAEGAMKDDLLPHLQQAVLYEYWLEDDEAAERQWRKVTELSRGNTELSGLLQVLRAQVMLERYEQARDGPP